MGNTRIVITIALVGILSACAAEQYSAPMVSAQIELGRKLFFDPLLSVDQSISCASCHKPEHGFADNIALSIGVTGVALRRHTPHLINLASGNSFFWDGRARSLEEQALMPIQDPDEMGLQLSVLITRLKDDAEYPSAFQSAFGSSEVSSSKIAKALAEFERSLNVDSSPYDNFLAGDVNALTASAQRGMDLFFSSRTKCSVCHKGSDFTDGEFHNTGIITDDLGRAEIDRVGNFKMRPYPFFQMQKAFKTPGLRDVSLTAPYMHNGVFASLEEVVASYNDGGQDPESYGISLDVKPIGLANQEIDDLVSFLHSLSSPYRWDSTLGKLTINGNQNVARK